MAWWLFRKKHSKNWYVGWRDEEGQQRSRSARTTDRALAKQQAARYERERLLAPADRPAYTLKAALNELVAHKVRSKRSAATLEITQCKCRHLVRVFGEKRDVTVLTLEDSNKYIDQRRAEGAHDHTILKELAQLLQALRIAHAATPPRFERDPRTIWPKEVLENAYVPCDEYWTVEQYHRAQAYGIESRLDHVAMYCHTGVRFSELYRIDARHVDVAGRRVFVDGTKGRHTKKRADRRWVPLDDEAFKVVQHRMQLHPTGPLFPDVWSRSRLVNDMKRVAKRAGVPALSANDFRRTFATWCGEAGVDERACYTWMGHTSGTMIRRVYQQLTERRAAAQGALLSGFTAGSSPGSKPLADRVQTLPTGAENPQ